MPRDRSSSTFVPSASDDLSQTTTETRTATLSSRSRSPLDSPSATLACASAPYLGSARKGGPSRDPDASSLSQEGINHGLLLRWTKGFGAPNVEGHDVAAMFAKSLEKFVRLPSPARARLRATSNPNPFPRPAGDSGPHDRSHQRHHGHLDRFGLRRPNYSSRSVKPRRPWPRPASKGAD